MTIMHFVVYSMPTVIRMDDISGMALSHPYGMRVIQKAVQQSVSRRIGHDGRKFERDERRRNKCDGLGMREDGTGPSANNGKGSMEKGQREQKKEKEAHLKP